ncbi:MAG: hypothetical protein C0408_00935 [Odoribacter sp.]|nr:hypothetical protein [Odoribacter sp.]
MKNQIILFVLLFAFSSCKTQLLYINVVQPAPVTLPAEIKNVAVINRSLPSEQTKKVDVIDKVLSLEGAKLDKEGAEASIAGLTDELMRNNRFSNVILITNIDLRSAGLGLFPPPLDWEFVAKMCSDNQVDALFTLELFDTDTQISYQAKKTGIKTPFGVIPALEHQADMITTVKTGWRIYDPAGKNILDEFAVNRDITFSGRGINPVAAAAGLMDRKEAVKNVALKAGRVYALRLLPFELRVNRDYYVKGTGNFKIAKRKAQTGNWDQAGELWNKETSNPKTKIAGRACYNMAIISEINGDLDLAVQWAQKSYEDYNNKLALRYIDILNYRINSNRLLQFQEER